MTQEFAALLGSSARTKGIVLAGLLIGVGMNWYGSLPVSLLFAAAILGTGCGYRFQTLKSSSGALLIPGLLQRCSLALLLVTGLGVILAWAVSVITAGERLSYNGPEVWGLAALVAVAAFNTAALVPKPWLGLVPQIFLFPIILFPSLERSYPWLLSASTQCFALAIALLMASQFIARSNSISKPYRFRLNDFKWKKLLSWPYRGADSRGFHSVAAASMMGSMVLVQLVIAWAFNDTYVHTSVIYMVVYVVAYNSAIHARTRLRSGWLYERPASRTILARSLLTRCCQSMSVSLMIAVIGFWLLDRSAFVEDIVKLGIVQISALILVTVAARYHPDIRAYTLCKLAFAAFCAVAVLGSLYTADRAQASWLFFTTTALLIATFLVPALGAKGFANANMGEVIKYSRS